LDDNVNLYFFLGWTLLLHHSISRRAIHPGPHLLLLRRTYLHPRNKCPHPTLQTVTTTRRHQISIRIRLDHNVVMHLVSAGDLIKVSIFLFNYWYFMFYVFRRWVPCNTCQ